MLENLKQKQRKRLKKLKNKKYKFQLTKKKLSWDLELGGFDAAKKISIIKEVRAIFNLGLKDAKDLVEKAPTIL